MSFNPNQAFFGPKAAPGYRHLGVLSFTENGLVDVLTENPSLAIFLGRLDITVYSRLKNLYPDKDFVTSTIFYAPESDNSPLSNTILFDDIDVVVSSLANKMIYTCTYRKFKLVFIDITIGNTGQTNNTLPGNNDKNIATGEHNIIEVTEDLLNIYRTLGGPEIIHIFQFYLSRDKGFRIKFLASAKLGDSVFIEKKDDKRFFLKKTDGTLIASVQIGD